MYEHANMLMKDALTSLGFSKPQGKRKHLFQGRGRGSKRARGNSGYNRHAALQKNSAKIIQPEPARANTFVVRGRDKSKGKRHPAPAQEKSQQN